MSLLSEAKGRRLCSVRDDERRAAGERGPDHARRKEEQKKPIP